MIYAILETILRLAAILLMISVMFGAGKIAWWLGSAWVASANVVPLAIQPFEVSHGDKIEKEEGKHLAVLLAKKIERIEGIMSADLTGLGDAHQVRIESVSPKDFKVAPDVPVKIDAEVKAFEVDVVGVFEKIYKFFDRSDRLRVAIWINDDIKVFASLKTADKERSAGPWWLNDLENGHAVVDTFAHVYALDLYKTRVRGLNGLDAASFAKFVDSLETYQSYVREHHSNPDGDYDDVLTELAETFEDLTQGTKSAALVYAYLGSVRTLQQDIDAAIAAYTQAISLDPDDKVTASALREQQAAKALQPKTVEAPPVAGIFDELRTQKLPGYDPVALPPAERPITVAVISTGINAELVRRLGERFVYSSSTVPNEPDADDHNGHGTSVVALVAALAPSAKIMSIKGLSKEGGGTQEGVAESIRTAIRKRADILLLPLAFRETIPSNKVEDAVKEALDAGLLVVASSGNDNGDEPLSPGRVPGVLATGAVDHSDKVTYYSNRGTNVVYAPGENILTLQDGQRRARFSGTSYSAAVAAAIAAAVWAAKPNLSAKQVRDLLISTSVDRGPVDPAKPQLGKIRRIDLAAALRPAS